MCGRIYASKSVVFPIYRLILVANIVIKWPQKAQSMWRREQGLLWCKISNPSESMRWYIRWI